LTLRIYEFIPIAQIFPYKNTVLKQIFLSFYWFIQDIYTILLSIDVKYGIKVEIEIEPEILMIKQKINAIKMNTYKLQQ